MYGPNPSGQMCSGSPTCEYDTISCCGEDHPYYTLECVGGHWNISYTHDTGACQGCTNSTNASECPSMHGPNPSGQMCSGSPTCEYGNISCCGEDHPEFTIECVGGHWNISYTHETGACQGCTNSTNTSECPSDEEFKQCGSCEPSCADPSPLVCTTKCRPECQCVDNLL